MVKRAMVVKAIRETGKKEEEPNEVKNGIDWEKLNYNRLSDSIERASLGWWFKAPGLKTGRW